MTHKFKIYTFFLISLSVIFIFQNCGQLSTNLTESKVSSLSDQEIVEQKAMLALTNKCSSCHNSEIPTAGVDVTHISQLLTTGALVPGEPSLSPLFQAIQSGRMPPSGSMSQADVQNIYAWIADGFKNPTSSTNLPSDIPVPLSGKYSSIYKNILQTKCLACHNTAKASGGISFSSYASTLNIVIKTNPGSSALYTSVAVRKTMPRGGSLLSSAETQAISDWITAGAPNN